MVLPAGDLSPAQRASVGCVLWMGYWWITLPVSAAVTALVPVCINALFHVLPMEEVIGCYFSEIVVLLLGANFISLSWEETGLDKRLAMKVLCLIGPRAEQQIAVWFLLSVALSMFLPNAVVCAILISIAVSMLKFIFEGDVLRSPVGPLILAVIAWGAGIGGLGTPLGGAMNLIAVEYLEKLSGREFLYADWVVRLCPVLLVLSAVTAEDYERDYNGKAVTPEELTLSAQFQGDNVPGSWTFKQAAPVNAGNHMATLIFTPDDQEIFGTVETIARVTIRQRNAVVGLQLDPGNRIYVGDDLPKAVLTFSGVLDGESIAADSFTLVGMPSDSSVAREYAISLSEDSQQAIRDRASNYNITFTGACLSTLSKGTEVPPSQDEENNRLEKTELTEVPEALKEAGFNTVEQIKETIYAAAVKKLPGVTLENTIFWDITLLYSEDGGKTWIEATAENFPANGITVTLPYPDGTNATDYDFVVTHMLTQAINGMEPGQVETPAVTKTGNGLQFTVNSLSPVAVSWKAVSKNDDGVTEGGTTVSDTAPAVPQTGDTSTPALWVELLILSGLSLGGLTLFRRKNGKNNPA